MHNWSSPPRWASHNAWWRTTKRQARSRAARRRIATNRLERRLLDIEKLDPKAKRQITQLLDTFIEREKLKQRVNAQEA
jgi:hypothetical protein